MQSKSDSDPPRPSGAIGIALASTVSQVGCVTVVVVIGALLLGLWLDSLLGTRPLLTIAFVLASIPVSLYSVVRIAQSAASRVRYPEDEAPPQD
ncbi:MAG: hypothetical protein GQ526_00625 [Ardenticatenales bacterium]|nr:hypothetical protein [Ardenticatenales bacterium]